MSALIGLQRKRIVRKMCGHCGERKPLDQYTRHRATRDRLSPWCRTCHLERTQQWRDENRDAINARRRVQYRALVAGVGGRQSIVNSDEAPNPAPTSYTHSGDSLQ